MNAVDRRSACSKSSSHPVKNWRLGRAQSGRALTIVLAFGVSGKWSILVIAHEDVGDHQVYWRPVLRPRRTETSLFGLQAGIENALQGNAQ